MRSTIVIFDSGVGGLSIYQEVARQCPQHNYVFVSDNQAFPYGTKSEAQLIERINAVVQGIDNHFAPDLLVIACNTASTIMLPLLREQYAYPIVGVVPAIKPAGEQSQSRCIGLLATRATIERSYTDNLIREFAADCAVLKVGSNALVKIAERKLQGESPDLGEIERILEPFWMTKNLDVLVLACTHFPLLNKEIESIFKLKNHSLDLIDSGAAIAQRVSSLLGVQTSKKSRIEALVAFTKQVENSALLATLSEFGFSKVQHLVIN